MKWKHWLVWGLLAVCNRSGRVCGARGGGVAAERMKRCGQERDALQARLAMVRDRLRAMQSSFGILPKMIRGGWLIGIVPCHSNFNGLLMLSIHMGYESLASQESKRPESKRWILLDGVHDLCPL